MASYTLSQQVLDSLGKNTVLNLYNGVMRCLFAKFQGKNKDHLDVIFKIAVTKPELFPPKNLSNPSPRDYIERWAREYVEAIECLPSMHHAKPKNSCSDPAISVIVKATQRLTDQDVKSGEESHNLFMSAENVQGNLLEEYIASRVEEYGFLWCAGRVLRAVDFCSMSGDFFLQIKNKYNTENSSSSKIREGTDIQKWFRLGQRSEKGIVVPVFKWEELNSIINCHKEKGKNLPPCHMSEADYNRFLESVSKKNQRLITKL